MNELDFPKLRVIDAFPVDTNRGRMVGIRDPHGIATDMLILSTDLFYLLQFFDGQHSVGDLRQRYLQTFGTLLHQDQLVQILQNLDSHLFLDSQAYRSRRQELEAAFAAAPVRPASHAGRSYEADPKKLRQQIDGFFRAPGGAGMPAGRAGRSRIKGVIAPHIDWRGGGPCYTHAYRALAESEPPECFVILGTGHTGLANLYSVLAKDFETPFGRVACDMDLVEHLVSETTEDYTGDLLPHKSEHTIEFQLVFLQHLFQGRHDFTMVPILCSFSYHMLDGERFARQRRLIDQFTHALKAALRRADKRVCLIASVDFSHVGPRYGDDTPPDDPFMAGVEAVDCELLRRTETLDAEGFLATLADHQDRYRVCGFSPVYTLLRCIEAQEGRLLNYAKTEVDPHHSTVTFASLAFY